MDPNTEKNTRQVGKQEQKRRGGGGWGIRGQVREGRQDKTRPLWLMFIHLPALSSAWHVRVFFGNGEAGLRCPTEEKNVLCMYFVTLHAFCLR